MENDKKLTHYIAVNEGAAISTAIGRHLSTNEVCCVYLQNSGLGNAVNPLISIAHKKVYSIPLLLLIGWRGSPNRNRYTDRQFNIYRSGCRSASTR